MYEEKIEEKRKKYVNFVNIKKLSVTPIIKKSDYLEREYFKRIIEVTLSTGNVYRIPLSSYDERALELVN